MMAPPVRTSSAVSREALRIGHAKEEIRRSIEQSQSLFGAKAQALQALCQMFLECSEPDWAASGAAPIDPVALSNAEDLIRALPSGLAMPEFAPEPDGSISIDWLPSRYRMISLSVGKTDRVAYAWLDGTDKGHAVSRFDGSKIPARLLEAVRSIVTS